MSRLILPARESWAHPFGIIDPGFSTGLIGAWRFGKPAGMTDAEARIACTPNKAPNRGVSGPQSARLVGSPTVNDNWFEFAAGSSWLTSGLKNPQSGEVSEFCIIAVFATDQNPINSAATRPYIAGWYGQNSGFGSGMVMNALSVIQGVSYTDVPGTATANLSLTGASPNTMTKFRALSLSRFGAPGAYTLKMQNLTADATTNTVTTAMTTIRNGGRAFSIGSAWNIYNAGAVPKIHAILVYDLTGTGADISDPNKATILASLRAGVAGTALANTF